MPQQYHAISPSLQWRLTNDFQATCEMLPFGRGKLGLRQRSSLCCVKGFFNAIIFSVAAIVSLSLLQIPAWTAERYDDSLHSLTLEDPSINFVLFLGIEGTGHHFWQDLVKESPMYDDVKAYGLHPTFTKTLTGSLYSHKKSRGKGLWSAPCKWADSDPQPNGTAIRIELVATLQAMKERVVVVVRQNNEGDSATKKEKMITFPVNFLATGDDFGVASYPGFLKPCRSLQYPNLDIWYDVCVEANVQCQHVYLYRDPYAVIRSTTDNRNINKDKLEAIHLYTTMLYTLYAQLSIFPDRLAGCWDYEKAISTDLPYKEVNDILGFPDDKALAHAIHKVYRPRPGLTEADKRNIVPLDFTVHMNSLSRIHDSVVNLCKHQRAVTNNCETGLTSHRVICNKPPV